MSLSSRRENLARLFNFANNPTSIAGAILTTMSGLLILVFIAIELFGELENPYTGIFAYLVLPGFFVLGLILLPFGMWRRRRALLASGTSDAELARFPRLDFNDPDLRRLGTTVFLLTVANAVILGASSFLAVEKMETVAFCGETCHTVMQPEFTAYQESPHSRVACVDCHIGPGASWFVRSKLDGLRQVWRTAFDTFDRPITTPIETLRPARETCEQCHWPTKHHGDRLQVIARFATDQANTPSYSALLLKTGGGSLDIGRHGGIHWWHIEADNRIRYLAGDERREEIVWVELTLPSGEIRTYSRPGADLPPADELERQARVMDCVDCHNRPTHTFPPPEKELDRVLENHPRLRDLPFFKREAVAAIRGDYPTHPEGMAAVRDRIEEYYRSEWPEVAGARSGDVAFAAEQAAEVYGRLVFPEMRTNWETHPNHIGHEDSPGCWRCHDDEMTTADGGHVIPMDCENCHVFLIEDASEPPDFVGALGG